MKTTQSSFDHLFRADEPNIRLDIFANKIGMSVKFAWKLWDEGILWGNRHHGSKEVFKTFEKGEQPESRVRITPTISRDCAIYYMTITSSASAEDRLIRLKELADYLTPEQLDKLSEHFQSTAMRKIKTNRTA